MVRVRNINHESTLVLEFEKLVLESDRLQFVQLILYIPVFRVHLFCLLVI